MIAFVGSVFSPYYAFSGRQNPENHCAINIALYDRRGDAWAMTERPSEDISRSQSQFVIGPSRLERDGQTFLISIEERSAPIPRKMSGEIRITLPWLSDRVFDLDPAGRHIWQPLCTRARVSVTFSAPHRRWEGTGYVDRNSGLEPLEQGFDYWDWSRTEDETGRTAIRYVADPAGGARRHLSLRFLEDGTLSNTEIEEDVPLSPTPIWRIKRRAGRLDTHAPSLVRTLEDTPFYSRSLMSYDGGRMRSVHESFSGRRLRSPIIKSLLPVRMPRRKA
ncbi:MAG: hypothetical protein AAFQ84_13300 [Pseudomonadota bacterium]